MGLRLTLSGAMTTMPATVGGTARATCTFSVCGDAALHDPHPQSNPSLGADCATDVVDATLAPSSGWSIAISRAISDPHVIPVA